MELLWKPLITVGKHVAPASDPKTGKMILRDEVVTPGRIKHFYESFKRLKARGINFPVPFGHKLLALPDERFDDDESFRKAVEKNNESKILGNAGFIEDMRISPSGDLEYAMYPPPGYEVCQETNDLINPHTGNRIREVSAGIGNWRDGKGELHKDIIVHAALCTMPVVAGMGRFRSDQIHLSSADSVEYTCWLSTTTGGRTVAKGKKKDDELDDEDPSKKPVDDSDGDDDDIFEDEDGEALNAEPPVETPPEEVPPIEPPTNDLTPPKTSNPDHVRACIDMLTTANLPLPPDTDEANFFERLLTALTVVAGMGGKFELADQQAETQPAPAAGSSEQQPPQPESPPVMMSLDAIQDRTARRFAKDKQRTVRKDLVATWEALKSLGCPVHIANREIAKVENVHLSLNTVTHRLRLPSQVSKVRLLQEVLEAISGQEAQVQLSTIALPNPIQQTQVAKGAPAAVPETMSDGESRQAWMERQVKSTFGQAATPGRVA